MKTIKEFFGGCTHKWVKLERLAIVPHGETRVIGVQYIMQCEKCGDIRSRRFEPQ